MSRDPTLLVCNKFANECATTCVPKTNLDCRNSSEHRPPTAVCDGKLLYHKTNVNTQSDWLISRIRQSWPQNFRGVCVGVLRSYITLRSYTVKQLPDGVFLSRITSAFAWDVTMHLLNCLSLELFLSFPEVLQHFACRITQLSTENQLVVCRSWMSRYGLHEVTMYVPSRLPHRRLN